VVVVVVLTVVQAALMALLVVRVAVVALRILPQEGQVRQIKEMLVEMLALEPTGRGLVAGVKGALDQMLLALPLGTEVQVLREQTE
tara:strand:- start:332 stop:589 length:258 start_codon:yes stop_codon:yes gene_type:complete